MRTGSATVVPISSVPRSVGAAEKPPAGYSAEARRLWTSVVAGWSLDPPGRVVLDAYCRALMRKRQAQALISKHGLLVRDRFRQLRANPAAVIERDADATMLRCCRALKLDLEPLREGPGRPGSEV